MTALKRFSWAHQFLQQDGEALLRNRGEAVRIETVPSLLIHRSEVITVKLGRQDACGTGRWRACRTLLVDDGAGSLPSGMTSRTGAPTLQLAKADEAPSREMSLSECLLEGAAVTSSTAAAGSPTLVGAQVKWKIECQDVFSLSSFIRCLLISAALAASQLALFVAFCSTEHGSWVLAATTLLCCGSITGVWRLSRSCAGIVGLAATVEPSIDAAPAGAGTVYEVFSISTTLDCEGSELVVRGRRKYCRTCRILRPVHASHCSICNVCVDRFDHHCSITDTCIGGSNIGRFVGFVWLTTIYVIVVFLIATAALFGSIPNASEGASPRAGASAALMALALAGAINLVPLGAGSALYVYLQLYLGGVSLWAHKKKGGPYDGFEMEEEFARIPKPFSHGTCSWRNIHALCAQ